MTAGLVDGVRALMARREQLTAELAELDAELREVRAMLGDVSSVRDEDLVAAIVSHLTTAGPRSLGALVRETKRSRHLVLGAIAASNGQIELVGNTTRRIVRLRGDSVEAAPYEPPEHKPRTLAPRTEDVTCVREGCGVIFRPSGGTSGLYCSRACYDEVRKGKIRQPVEPRREARAPSPQSSGQFAERRCGRCMKKFTPTRDKQYVCDGCEDKPTNVRPEPTPQLEHHWSPGKDSRSLTGDAAGLGQSLAGSSLKGGR